MYEDRWENSSGPWPSNHTLLQPPPSHPPPPYTNIRTLTVAMMSPVTQHTGKDKALGARDDLHVSAASDHARVSTTAVDMKDSTPFDNMKASAASDGVMVSSASDGVKVSAARDDVKVSGLGRDYLTVLFRQWGRTVHKSLHTRNHHLRCTRDTCRLVAHDPKASHISVCQESGDLHVCTATHCTRTVAVDQHTNTCGVTQKSFGPTTTCDTEALYRDFGLIRHDGRKSTTNGRNTTCRSYRAVQSVGQRRVRLGPCPWKSPTSPQSVGFCGVWSRSLTQSTHRQPVYPTDPPEFVIAQGQVIMGIKKTGPELPDSAPTVWRSANQTQRSHARWLGCSSLALTPPNRTAVMRLHPNRKQHRQGKINSDCRRALATTLRDYPSQFGRVQGRGVQAQQLVPPDRAYSNNLRTRFLKTLDTLVKSFQYRTYQVRFGQDIAPLLAPSPGGTGGGACLRPDVQASFVEIRSSLSQPLAGKRKRSPGIPSTQAPAGEELLDHPALRGDPHATWSKRPRRTQTRGRTEHILICSAQNDQNRSRCRLRRSFNRRPPTDKRIIAYHAPEKLSSCGTPPLTCEAVGFDVMRSLVFDGVDCGEGFVSDTHGLHRLGSLCCRLWRLMVVRSSLAMDYWRYSYDLHCLVLLYMAGTGGRVSPSTGQTFVFPVYDLARCLPWGQHLAHFGYDPERVESATAFLVECLNTMEAAHEHAGKGNPYKHTGPVSPATPPEPVIREVA